MKFEERLITTKEALEMLSNNSENRNVKKVHLAWITEQMEQGKWKEQTGEAIKFSKTGKLLDGQHRLSGVVKSGKPCKFLVVTDLDDDIFTVIDSGVARSGGDALHILGVPNSFNVSAMIRFFWMIENNDWDFGKNYKRINSEDIVNIYRNDAQEWQSLCSKALHFYSAFNRMMTQTFIGAWYKYLYDKAPDQTDVFFNRLCLGVGIKSTIDPIAVYRDHLVNMRLNRMTMGQRSKNGHFITVWNAFIENRRFKKIPWNPIKDAIPALLLPKKTK